MQTTLGSEIGWGAAGLAIGAAIGAFNGVFVALLRLQPIVVTLASMFIVQGITLLVMDKPGGQIAPDFSTFLTGSAIPNVLPAAVVILGIALLLWTALAHSRFGTSLYAVGSDEDAAAAAGIRVVPTEFAAYTLAGLMYGAAGVFVSAQTGSGDPLVGNPLLLQVFAAIVIGGTVFGGGRGGCLGSVFGSYSLMLIINILLILNVSPTTRPSWKARFWRWRRWASRSTGGRRSRNGCAGSRIARGCRVATRPRNRRGRWYSSPSRCRPANGCPGGGAMPRICATRCRPMSVSCWC